MEDILGLLKVRVVRGVNLAWRDTRGSDPYVVLRMGGQKLKTSVKKANVNPVWNEDLTLSLSNTVERVKLEVYDKDTFTRDDRMGDAEFDINPLMEATKMDLKGLADDIRLRTVIPTGENCLSEMSYVLWKDGKVTQDLILRLRNVESGEVELKLQLLIPGVTHL